MCQLYRKQGKVHSNVCTTSNLVTHFSCDYTFWSFEYAPWIHSFTSVPTKLCFSRISCHPSHHESSHLRFHTDQNSEESSWFLSHFKFSETLIVLAMWNLNNINIQGLPWDKFSRKWSHWIMCFNYVAIDIVGSLTFSWKKCLII